MGIIKMDLPSGYLLMSSPDEKSYLLGFLPDDSQQVREIEWFDTLPTKEECLAAIKNKLEDWNCAQIPNK